MFDLSTQKTGPLRRVRTRHGDFLTLASDSAGIGALLAYYGEYAQRELDLLQALTKPGHAVALVNLRALLAPGGVLQQLQARGFKVAKPDVGD